MYRLAWKGVLIPLKIRSFKTVHKMRLYRSRWFDFGRIFKRDNNKSYKIKELFFWTDVTLPVKIYLTHVLALLLPRSQAEISLRPRKFWDFARGGELGF